MISPRGSRNVCGGGARGGGGDESRLPRPDYRASADRSGVVDAAATAELVITRVFGSFGAEIFGSLHLDERLKRSENQLREKRVEDFDRKIMKNKIFFQV